MHRPGANPDDMRASDFLCDFCGRAWDGRSPVVEGHRGGLICGECLAAAYRSLALKDESTATEGYTCVLCLEQRKEAGWTGAAGAVVCRRCAKQSAAVLAKSKDYEWSKPV
jgi:hypothetical protein